MLPKCKKRHGSRQGAMRGDQTNSTNSHTHEIKSTSLLIAAVMVATLASAQSIKLPPRVFAAAGTGAQSTSISCAVVGEPKEPGESNLFIITADPQVTSPPFVSTGFKQIAGVTRGRDVSCVGSNDPSLPDDVSWAAEIERRADPYSRFLSTPRLSAIAGLKFNSTTLATSGLQEPVSARLFNVTALNCISLFINQNQISCGIATAAGAFGADVTFGQGME